MLVMEIYRSIQGEGTLMGVPTTFVRFFACNLRCSWCDTKYSWSVREGGSWQNLTPYTVAQKIADLQTRHVVLTGGEPTLQKELPELAVILKAQGYHLTIETNATLVPEQLLPLIDLWSLSPKLGSAGENYIRPQVLTRFLATLRPEQQQWKFVIRDNNDEAMLRTLLESHSTFIERQIPIVLQPEGDSAYSDYPRALENLATRLNDPFWHSYNVRILPQLHIIIWGRKRLV